MIASHDGLNHYHVSYRDIDGNAWGEIQYASPTPVLSGNGLIEQIRAEISRRRGGHHIIIVSISVLAAARGTS